MLQCSPHPHALHPIRRSGFATTGSWVWTCPLFLWPCGPARPPPPPPPIPSSPSFTPTCTTCSTAHRPTPPLQVSGSCRRGAKTRHQGQHCAATTIGFMVAPPGAARRGATPNDPVLPRLRLSVRGKKFRSQLGFMVADTQLVAGHNCSNTRGRPTGCRHLCPLAGKHGRLFAS